VPNKQHNEACEQWLSIDNPEEVKKSAAIQQQLNNTLVSELKEVD